MTSRLRMTRFLICAAVLAAGPAGAEWVEWIADAQVETEFNDNLNQTAFDNDEASDFVFTPSVSLGRSFQAAEKTRLSATVDVDGRIHNRWDRLNSIFVGVTAAMHHKFGLGPRKPWVRTHLKVGNRNFRDDPRDSWIWESGLEFGQRFSPRLDASLSYRYDKRKAKNGGPIGRPGFARDVWDQAGHEVTMVTNYLVTEAALFSFGLEYRNGDFESSCPKNMVGAALMGEKPQAVAIDHVFGNTQTDCMYRIDGEIYSAFVNLNYLIGDHTTIDVGYRFKHGDGHKLHYQSNIATLTVSYRY